MDAVYCPHMNFSSTLLILPPNDAEAMLIKKLAEVISLPMLLSTQKHGASLDEEKDLVSLVKKTKCKRVVIVEMPGEKTEAKLRKLGVELIIIDHHNYTGLDRARNSKTGRLLPSSLEQFLKLFKLTDAKLNALKFDPRLVLGIGIMDKGYIWALQDAKYTKKQIEKVVAFRDELVKPLQNPKTEAKKDRAVAAAWAKRVEWNGYFIVETRADVQLRPRLSRVVAMKFGKPTSLIIIEHKRKLIYVQESKYAMKLFKAFGGFTFGMDHNWGYRNEPGKKRVGLKEVKEVLYA
ncbi:hypothetical protein A3C09_03700 [Candidatus Uhrbacteria bacterium RIFCSPHIGHO2_02_FULL_47_44]|nr:MAG: hypothetical protein A3C09_03700 [Candidatus Uhrbacteria bacterium RIFCSPHIGHO2_02_FULL_47_44]OGL91892.1 MAG: hypothetical protein A3H12_04235 [Candidatus Uhrbacteria bacterium RIFCSPLOWO2_12_FULL_47_9]